MEFSLSKISDWEVVANEVIKHLKHNILLLRGNLGAGKTTFTQFLVKKLGSDDVVSSPTYSIVNEYNTSNGKIFHFDLYRLKSIEEAFDFGIEEYLESGALCIIEWPDIYEEELDDYPYHEIIIKENDGSRLVEFH